MCGFSMTPDTSHLTLEDYRPSVMELGIPFSQPRGEFQGRTEALSGSVVAQPAAPATTSANKRRNIQLEIAADGFMKKRD
jgi:hypothetical protein